jgi:hypothetical protein
VKNSRKHSKGKTGRRGMSPKRKLASATEELKTSREKLATALGENTDSSTRQNAAETKEESMGGPQAIDDMVTEVHDTVGVMDSAIVYIETVPTLIANAVSEALANGATAEQLAPLTDLHTQLDAKRQALADALAANAPPAPTA